MARDHFDGEEAGLALAAVLVALATGVLQVTVSTATRPFVKYGPHPALLAIAGLWLGALLVALALAQRPAVQGAAAWLAGGATLIALIALLAAETALDALAAQPPPDADIADWLAPAWRSAPIDAHADDW